MEEQRQEGPLRIGEVNDIRATGGLQSVKAPGRCPGDKEWIDKEVPHSLLIRLYFIFSENGNLLRVSSKESTWLHLRKITVVAAMLKN